MRSALALVFVVASGTPGVPAYKAHLASICRANTPSLKLYTRRIVEAQQKNDVDATLLNYRLALELGLKQDTSIYAVPIPAAAKPRMAPILKKLHATDPLIRSAITADKKRNALTLQALIKRINVLGVAANRLFDGYGIPDCGSKQS